MIHVVFDTGKPADRVLAAHFRENKKYGSADRRMISELYFSVLRWWGWLRHFPGGDARSAADGARIASAPEWLAVLYSAALLDRLPAERTLGVWHPILRSSYKLPYLVTPLPEDNLVAGRLLCRWFKVNSGIVVPENLVPEWIWQELPDCNREKLFDTWQRRPPLWLRVQNGGRDSLIADLATHDLEAQGLSHHDNALALYNARPNLYQLPSFRAGRFEVQDLASQVIGLSCNAKPGQRWWDACAGAGGKSLQLGAMMENSGNVVASDIREYKLLDLKKRARRSKLHNIRCKPWAGRRIPVQSANFDGVLVDAPCTCSGTWRRNPDARWTTPATELDEISTLQLDILNRAHAAVRPGGRLVYATCSLCRQENETVTEAFLAEHPQFELAPLPHPLTGESTSGMLRVWPYDADCDGAFVAVMQREK